MNALFETILDRLRAQRPLILVSILSSSGSTPRGAGAAMLVLDDKTAVGTIGGGAVEHAVQQRAGALLSQKASDSQRYGLTKDDASNLGMICGGSLVVHFQYLGPENKELLALFEKAAELSGQRQSAWLLRRIHNGRTAAMGLFYGGALHFTDAFDEAEVRPLLKNRPVLTQGDPALFVEPIAGGGQVYIFGGGHVSQELVPVLTRVGFPCVVFEEREEFAHPALFPGAEGTVVGSFERVAEKVRLGPEDYVVIVTRGHDGDRAVLRQAIQSGASYIGCIGSCHKVAATKRALMEQNGFTDEDFVRVCMPIGLEIQAETPAEIAVSIAAEMILHRARQRAL